MIQNKKYQKFIENIIKKSVNKDEKNIYKFSQFSNKKRKDNKEGSVKHRETKIKKKIIMNYFP